ncbi:hypothetical protein OBBRIDRAFT_653219 [Obba rivulosa]|uniref:Uncharacterized protein n=1 Tax=Obba rivulosa TaxID=1052685 RepID=A0A8E2AZZ6_9APHY|nr:hypothetical protein OBBRIDRAFT_653219 [Obba rivulosa]
MKNFVRLGHIKDLVINNPRYSEGILEFPVMAPGKTSIPIIIARGNVHECLIFSHLVSVKDWCMRIYWEKLLEIAELHRIPIHDMAIVHEMDFKAQLSVLNECSAKSCALVSLPSEDAGIQVLADQGILPSLQRFQCGSCIKNMDVQGDDSGGEYLNGDMAQHIRKLRGMQFIPQSSSILRETKIRQR